jgi:hypothetical protein
MTNSNTVMLDMSTINIFSDCDSGIWSRCLSWSW